MPALAKRFSWFCAVATAAMSLCALVGWWTGALVLARGPSSWPAMLPATAVGLLLTSTALGVLSYDGRVPALVDRCVRGGGSLLVTALGLSMVVAYARHTTHPLDHFLFDQSVRRVTQGVSFPGRMSPQTAAAFSLLGVGLLASHGARTRPLMHALSLCAAGLGLLSLVGHIFQVIPFFGISSNVGMGIGTAFGVALGASGLLLMEGPQGPLAVLGEPGSTGRVIRLLFGLSISLPVVIAAAVRLGLWTGLFEARTAAALPTFLMSVVMGFWSLRAGRTIRDADDQRKRNALEESRRRALEEALALRDEFIQAASHELRTPLTPLLLALQRLERAELENGPQRAEIVLSMTRDATRHVRRVTDRVSSLLTVSEAESLELSLESVDVSEVVRAVVEENAYRLEHSGSKLEVQLVAARARVDVARLRDAFTAILGNAIKFGRGARIQIRVVVEGERIRLSVLDEGIGLGAHELEKVFQRYHRGASENYGGLGLGLYMARRVFEGMGGDLNAEHGPGKGALLVAHLPLQLPPP